MNGEEIVFFIITFALMAALCLFALEGVTEESEEDRED